MLLNYLYKLYITFNSFRIYLYSVKQQQQLAKTFISYNLY